MGTPRGPTIDGGGAGGGDASAGPAPGDPAPAFELPAAPGELVDLGERIGREKVVLLFFPLAFSSVCTRELCTIRDAWDGWSELDARVFAISVDSPFVARRFRQEEALPFPVLSDFNREAITAYGVLEPDFHGLRGVAKRAVFVIGSDGTVAYRWVTDDADVEPDYAGVRAAVARAG